MLVVLLIFYIDLSILCFIANWDEIWLKKIQSRATETANQVFLQGTYMAQNFIPKTLTSLYSITKGISKMYQLEREQWLSEVLQKHQSSIIYSFIFIHSLMSETKMYL